MKNYFCFEKTQLHSQLLEKHERYDSQSFYKKDLKIVLRLNEKKRANRIARKNSRSAAGNEKECEDEIDRKEYVKIEVEDNGKGRILSCSANEQLVPFTGMANYIL